MLGPQVRYPKRLNCLWLGRHRGQECQRAKGPRTPPGATIHCCYPVLNHADWWIGRIEEVPGVNSQGQSREELLDNFRDALEEALEMNRADARRAATGTYEEVNNLA